MIERTVINVIKRERFYGELLMRMHRTITKAIPTAGVTVKSDGLHLYINPDFYASLNEEQAVDVMIHECLHLLHSHITRAGQRNPKLWNIACDIAINQMIPDMLEHFADHDAKPLMPFEGQELNREAEYYFNDIVKQLKNDPQFCDGKGTLDDHGIWQESDLSPEAQKEVLVSATKAAKAAAGAVSGELSGILDRLHHKPLNWKALLRRFVANAENVYKNKTVMRANRRFGFAMPGIIKKRKIKLAVCVDTSGSVSDQALSAFFTEIDNITKNNCDVVLIQADCEVKDVTEYKTGKWPKISGRGGTAYDPALKAAVKEGVDGIIYFGDMDTADVPDKPRTAPVMWVSCGSDRRPGEFGQMVMIKAGE